MLPIHRKPRMLKYAIASVLSQSEQDFQLHIISDGAPEETMDELRKISQKQKKVTIHIFPKAERNGEIYRDQIIKGTQSQFICQIADDDIWFPDHLCEIDKLLKTVDFGNTIQVEAAPQNRLLPIIGDISDAKTASKMITERFIFLVHQHPDIAAVPMRSLRSAGHLLHRVYGQISIFGDRFSGAKWIV